MIEDKIALVMAIIVIITSFVGLISFCNSMCWVLTLRKSFLEEIENLKEKEKMLSA